MEMAHKMKYWLEHGEAKYHFDNHTDYAGHDLNANVRQYKLLNYCMMIFTYQILNSSF